MDKMMSELHINIFFILIGKYVNGRILELFLHCKIHHDNSHTNHVIIPNDIFPELLEHAW